MDVQTVKAIIAAKVEDGTADVNELKMHEIFTILNKSRERDQWIIDHPLLSLFWTPKSLRKEVKS